MAIKLKLTGIIDEEAENEFIEQLPDDGDIVVEINSPGGSVFSGFAIYNKLKDLKGKVTIDILGLAASAASFIAMAGDEILMRKNSKMMIHNPFSGAIGDSKRLKEMSKNLEDLEDDLVNIYSARTRLPKKEIREMMNKETWMKASEAVKKGFATRVIEKAENVVAEFVQAFKEFGYVNIPDDYFIKEWTFRGALYREDFKFGDVKIGKHVYPLNKESITMIGQFTELAGIDDPVKALEYFKTLIKENKRLEFNSGQLNDKTKVEFVALQETVNTQNNQIQALTASLKDATNYQRSQQLSERRVRLQKCFDEFKFDAGQLEKDISAFVEIEDDQAEATNTVFEAVIERWESAPARKDLQELSSEAGSGGEGKPKITYVDDDEKGTAVAQEVNDKIVAMRAEDKELSYAAAYIKLQTSEPELVKKYEQQ